jgi:transposase
MSGKRKSCASAYRREAARLVTDTGRSIAVVARELGVGEALLGRWVGVERSRMDVVPAASDADERAELERLRVENAELRLDQEFVEKGRRWTVQRPLMPRSGSRGRVVPTDVVDDPTQR